MTHRWGARVTALVTVTTFVAGMATLGVRWKPLHRQLVLSTTRRPARYTELFFAAADPVGLGSQKGTATVTFTIVNHQAARTTYRIEVQVASHLHTTDVEDTSLTLADGGAIDHTTTFPIPAKPWIITVSLSTGESISYQSP